MRRDELAALNAFYGKEVRVPSRALDRYAEWVLARDDFAVVTLGDIGLAGLGSHMAPSRFRGAAERWPRAILGIKLEAQPTLYVRTVCPWAEGAAWLDQIGLDGAAVPPARTLYGLGFQGDIVKTYALTDGGFVSFRLDGEGLRRERKEYRADVDWSEIAWPDSRWAALGELGRALGFGRAGHVALDSGGQMKIYVERVGAIPTDRSLA
jgi:hypothetical protein